MKKLVPVLKSLRVGDDVILLEKLLGAAFEDISEAAEQIPAAIGWLGYQRALAAESLILSEHAWKKQESKVYFELKGGRYISEGFGDKAPSEDALKRAVLISEEVGTACANYAACKRNIEWIAASIDALQAKLELVRSSEATRRMEHEPDRLKRNVD
jgi:hypothetical protein